jgi:hypothetical protein
LKPRKNVEDTLIGSRAIKPTRSSRSRPAARSD